MKTFQYYIVIILNILILVSCNNKEFSDVSPCNEEAEKNFLFTISMGIEDAPNVPGRAFAFGQSRLIGNDFETWIDESKLHVLIYSAATDGALTYVGEIEEIIPQNSYTSNGLFWFTFTGRTSLELKVGTSYRFMIVANTSLPSNLSNLENPTYNINDIDSKTGVIPLWGVVSYTILDLKDQVLPSAELIRAISKVELVLSDQLIADGWTFKNAQLHNYAMDGLAYPKKWTTATNTSTLIKSTVESNLFNPKTDNLNHSTSRDFHATDEKKVDYVVYVPEYKIPASGEVNVPSVDVCVLKDGQSYDYKSIVTFNDPRFYSSTSDPVDGKKFHNIVRNHNYKFIVTSISAGHTVELKCQVQRWHLQKEELDYVNYISALAEWKLTWSVPTFDYQAGTSGGKKKKVYSTHAGISCTFGLSTPKGATWYAVLVPVAGSFDAFSFVETVKGKPTNVGLTTHGPVGKLTTLHIVQTHSSVHEKAIMRLKFYVKDRNNKSFAVKPDVLGGYEYYIIQTVK